MYIQKKYLVQAQKEQEERNSIKTDQTLGGGESVHVRTVCHGCHFSDLPCGEITIEGTSLVKHCTTAKQRTVQG